MVNNAKNWLWGGLALLGGYSLLSLSRLNSLSKEFVIDAVPRLHKASWDGLTIAVDITFKNPTDAVIVMSHPLLAIYADQATLATNQPLVTSVVQGHTYTIGANGQTQLQPIYLTIPLSVTNALLALSWVKTYLRGEAVHLIGRATTKVNGLRVEKLMPVSVQLNPPVTLALAAKVYPDGDTLRVRLRLLATNAKSANQAVTTRLAVYATERDRLVDAPLWESARLSSTLLAGKQSQLALTDGRFAKASLAAYPGLSSLVVVATVTAGSKVAQTLIRAELPSRAA